MKKTQPKKQTTQKPAVNAAPVDNKQQETASQPPENVTPPVVPPAAVAPPVSTETAKEDKPKAPSISTVVRKLVINNPDKSVDEISQLLIDSGWDAGDVEKRKSTIATLRTDGSRHPEDREGVWMGEEMNFTLAVRDPQAHRPCGFFHFVTPELKPNNGIYTQEIMG